MCACTTCLSLKNRSAINFHSFTKKIFFANERSTNREPRADKSIKRSGLVKYRKCKLNRTQDWSKFETYIFVAHSNHEISSFEIHFGDSRPVVMSHSRLIPQHNDSTRRKSQEVLDAIFALKFTQSYNSNKRSASTCKEKWKLIKIKWTDINCHEKYN